MKRLLLLTAALMACHDATAPHHYVTTCRPLTIAGVAVSGDSVCEWLDTTTGQGGPGRHP